MIHVDPRKAITILILIFPAETSDHSDMEARIKQLKLVISKRKGEARRLRNERKKVRKQELKAKEARLMKELEVRK